MSVAKPRRWSGEAPTVDNVWQNSVFVVVTLAARAFRLASRRLGFAKIAFA